MIRRRRGSGRDEGAVILSVLVLMVLFLLGAAVVILMPLGRAADLRERAQAAADAAALAGAEDVREELLRRLSRPIDRADVDSWVMCPSGGSEAVRYASLNDASITRYCYVVGTDRVEVAVRGRTGVDGIAARPEASAAAELGLRWTQCRWEDDPLLPLLRTHWRCGALDVPFDIIPVTGKVRMAIPPGALRTQLEPRLVS